MDDKNLGQELWHAVQDGLRKAVADKLGSSYNNPLEKVLNSIMTSQESEIRGLLLESITTALKDQAFREEIAVAVRKSLAKTLIQRFGGELEKTVNQLKSDPATRAPSVGADVVRGGRRLPAAPADSFPVARLYPQTGWLRRSANGRPPPALPPQGGNSGRECGFESHSAKSPHWGARTPRIGDVPD